MFKRKQENTTEKDSDKKEKKSFFRSWKGRIFIGLVGIFVLAAIVGESPEEKASKAGFESVKQMDKAKELGFSTGSDYQAYLAKKAEEKRLAEEEKRLAEAEEKRKKEAEKAAEEQRLKKLLQENLENAQWLVDDYNASAKGTYGCQKRVEKLAKFDFEWTDGWLGSKFPSYLTKTQSPGVVVLVGDKVKFQNGFGAWAPVKYYCAYDVINDNVLDVWTR